MSGNTWDDDCAFCIEPLNYPEAKTKYDIEVIANPSIEAPEDMGRVIKLECGHMFHKSCFLRYYQGIRASRWYGSFIRCPLCRAKVAMKYVQNDSVLVCKNIEQYFHGTESVDQVRARTTHFPFPYTGNNADLDRIADNVIPPVTVDLISDTEAPEAGVASESKVETSQPIESKEQTPEADASAASESKVEFTSSAGGYRYIPIGETELATINNTSVTTRVYSNGQDPVTLKILVDGFLDEIIVQDGELVRYRRQLYIVRRLRRNVNNDRYSMEVTGASSRTFTIHLPNGARDFDFNVLPRNYAEEKTVAKHRKMKRRMERIKYFIRKNRADWSRGRTYVNDAGEQKEYRFDGIFGVAYGTFRMDDVPTTVVPEIHVYDDREIVRYRSGKDNNVYNRFRTIVRVNETRYKELVKLKNIPKNEYIQRVKNKLQERFPGKKWFITKPLADDNKVYVREINDIIWHQDVYSAVKRNKTLQQHIDSIKLKPGYQNASVTKLTPQKCGVEVMRDFLDTVEDLSVPTAQANTDVHTRNAAIRDQLATNETAALSSLDVPPIYKKLIPKILGNTANKFNVPILNYFTLDTDEYGDGSDTRKNIQTMINNITQTAKNTFKKRCREAVTKLYPNATPEEKLQRTQALELTRKRVFEGRQVFKKDRRLRHGRIVPTPVRVKDLDGEYHDIWHIPIYNWQHSHTWSNGKDPIIQYRGNYFGYVHKIAGVQTGQHTRRKVASENLRHRRAQQALQAQQAQRRRERGQTRRQNRQGGRPQTQRRRGQTRRQDTQDERSRTQRRRRQNRQGGRPQTQRRRTEVPSWVGVELAWNSQTPNEKSDAVKLRF